MQIQMAELKQAEMELGVKFWKIKVTNSRLRSFWRQMFHVSASRPQRGRPCYYTC